jgi:GTPase Era involved in 16S rRNA processing
LEHRTLNYTDLKEKVVIQLQALQEFIAERGYRDREAEAAELVTKLKEDKVNLVVLGHFNRGKSTFINSLLGEDLLPTSIIPLTSVITLIKYGETFKIDVYFKNRTSREIDAKEIADYATEEGNPRNQKNVERIEISFPAPYLRNGIIVVDTPGFSSVHVSNTRITQNYLPEADVAMFLITADPPISQIEIEFLKEIKNFTNKIFILQNKIDQVNEAEKQKSLEFSKRIIETTLGLQNLKIYPISAKLALEGELEKNPQKVAVSLLPDFERALEEFLLREKGRFVLLTAIEQGLKLLAEVKVTLEMERGAYLTSHRNLENNAKTFNDRLVLLQQEQKDLRDQIQGTAQRLLKSLKPKPVKPEQVAFVKEAFQICYEAHQDDERKTLVQTLETCFKQSVQNALKASVLPEYLEIQKEFDEAVTRFIDRIHGLAEQIRQLSAELFDIQIEKPQAVEFRKSESEMFPTGPSEGIDLYFPPMETEDQSLFKISPFSLLLPKKYFQGLMWQEMLRKVESELKRQGEQLCQGFAERIQQRAGKLPEIMDQQINAIVESIQNALKRALEVKVKSKKKAEQTVKILDEKLFQLQLIRRKLLDLQKAILPQEGESHPNPSIQN